MRHAREQEVNMIRGRLLLAVTAVVLVAGVGSAQEYINKDICNHSSSPQVGVKVEFYDPVDVVYVFRGVFGTVTFSTASGKDTSFICWTDPSAPIQPDQCVHIGWDLAGPGKMTGMGWANDECGLVAGRLWNVQANQYFGSEEGQSAICITNVDGAELRDIHIHDIDIRSRTKVPICLKLGARLRPYENPAARPVGTFRSVVLESIRAHNSLNSTHACTVAGVRTDAGTHCVEDIVLRNIDLRFTGTAEKTALSEYGAVEENADQYPHPHVLGEIHQAHQALLNAGLGHKGAPPLFPRDKPLVGQQIEYLAHRGAAHLIALDQLRLGWDQVARLPLAADDVGAQDDVQLVIER